ncbi:nuclear transport factor 2 family protein [Pedobacter panaciterrae]|uniref:Nuclear transport factor 2 family protein n=1 Tax=Pedobacter panaciterrae TaxID=363849 RepID=A0ABU8NHL0_9SPHI
MRQIKSGRGPGNTSVKDKVIKRSLSLIMLLLIVPPVAAYCQKNQKTRHDMQTNKSDESKILEVTRRLSDLMIRRDTIAMNEIVDKAFTLTHITGYVQAKEEWFAEVESESMKYYSYKEIKTTINRQGDKATFVGQNLLDARIWGARNTWRLQQTMTLEKRQERWIILKSVATTF